MATSTNRGHSVRYDHTKGQWEYIDNGKKVYEERACANCGQEPLSLRVPVGWDKSRLVVTRWKDRFVDACIASVVMAFNNGGIFTSNCCCGHGKRDGLILLHDGRALEITNPKKGKTQMQEYRKKGVTPMEPWTPEVDMEGVSVAEEDKVAGSPREGDMIATNPDNPADRWLVAKAYFEKNYTATTEGSTHPLATVNQALERLRLVSNLRYLSTFECQHHPSSDCYADGAGAACNSCWARNFARETLDKYEELFEEMGQEIKNGTQEKP